MGISTIDKDTLILDRRGLGIRPFWDSPLCYLIDLEQSSKQEPDGMFIVRASLEGYTQREIGQHLGLHHSAVQRTLKRCFIGSRVGCAYKITHN